MLSILFNSILSIALLVSSSFITPSQAQFSGTGVRCTYHDYEADQDRLGMSYDNSPGWCGIRYSVLNTARITAVNGLDSSLCNRCLEVTPSGGGGNPIYVLAVDYKADPGLDIARSSFARLFPGSNPLDPQSCDYRVVDSSYCTGVCAGTPGECTPGMRNLLPANSLPPMPRNGRGFGNTNGGGNGNSNNNSSSSNNGNSDNSANFRSTASPAASTTTTTTSPPTLSTTNTEPSVQPTETSFVNATTTDEKDTVAKVEIPGQVNPVTASAHSNTWSSSSMIGILMVSTLMSFV